MSAYTKDVFGFKDKTNSKGPWLEFKSREVGKSDEWTENVFGLIAKQMMGSGEGRYEFTYVKKGKYLNISEAKFLGSQNSGAAQSAAPAAAPANGSQGKAAVPANGSTGVILDARSRAVEVCVSSAAQVIAAALGAGAYKTDKGVDVSTAYADVGNLTDGLLIQARAFMSGKSAEAVPAARQTEGA